jgi:hypothetical protein
MFRRVNGDVLAPVLAPPDEDKVRITWIGHASFFLQFARLRIDRRFDRIDQVVAESFSTPT